MADIVCKVCNGNDRDQPCAYPGEGKPWCLRDQRLANERKGKCLLPGCNEDVEIPGKLFCRGHAYAVLI